MKNMPDTFSIDFACLQTSPFETVIIIRLKGIKIKSANMHSPAPSWAMIADARSLGTFENQDGPNVKTRYISTISRKNRGLWTVYKIGERTKFYFAQ